MEFFQGLITAVHALDPRLWYFVSGMAVAGLPALILLRMKKRQVAERDQLVNELEKEQAVLEERLDQLPDTRELLEYAGRQLNAEFENLAHRIFDEKGRRFQEQNQSSLDRLLTPLKGQLDSFRSKVEEVYRIEGQERASLKTQIQQLALANEHVTTEAGNLARALKGDSKVRGNWGEMILERVLEQSGLKSGREFDREVVFTTRSGNRLRPDVVVHLPGNRDIVIDAKVSLVDYERYSSAEQNDIREKALAAHVASMQGHINNLCRKSYEDIAEINSLDLVLMFVPVEAAFLVAVDHNPEFLSRALEKKIVVVTPGTLLATLKTVDHVWRSERQNDNAAQIADKAAAIYDKFCSFVEDMDKLGQQMQTAQRSYESAMNRLSSGRGNLVSQAQGFIELGIRVKKRLPEVADDPVHVSETGKPDPVRGLADN